MVLSEGSVVEAGHPHLLLQAPAGGGATTAGAAAGGGGDASSEIGGGGGGGGGSASATLASMVEETGPSTAEHLKLLAKEAWEASQLTEASSLA